MSITSPFLKLTLQELNENPDTWGNVLNSGALELLEDAIAATATANVTSGNVALNEDVGADNDPHYRKMIVNITGAPGVARAVTCPAISKLYVVVNSTTGGFTITFRTTAGSGITIPAGTAVLCYCDGTNIVAISAANAATATTALSASDSDALGGFAAALYARLAAAQTWTAGQVTEAEEITVSGVGPYYLTVNCALSNCFYHSTTQNFTLQAPTNATVGQRFSLIVEQGAGGPHTIAYAASTFQAAGGSAPVLSTAVGDVDYLGFEYYSSSVGNRWIVSMLKGVDGI